VLELIRERAQDQHLGGPQRIFPRLSEGDGAGHLPHLGEPAALLLALDFDDVAHGVPRLHPVATP